MYSNNNVLVKFLKVLIFLLVMSKNTIMASNKQQELIAANKNESYSFLCWLPVPMKSHHGLFQPLLKRLAEKGHHVTVITPYEISDPPKNLKQIIMSNHYESIKSQISQKGLFSEFLPFIMRRLTKYTIKLYDDPVIQKFLNEENKFDAIIMESIVMNEAFIGLHHKYNAPVIDVMPPADYHWAYYLYGVPFDTSYIVEMQTSFSDRMSFFERLQNTLYSLSLRLIMEYSYIPIMQDIMDKNLRYPGWETRPPIMDMLRNISLALINTHFTVGYPYPLPPNAKQIAGINIPASKPLPKEIQEFMDSATDGVIIFSIGSHLSMIDSFGKENIHKFSNYFSKLKEKVIWKWDSDFFDVSNNIKLVKWFPQTDVLAHKNCKLFITHGGFHSLLESIYHGVPMVSIPIFGDQSKNAKIVVHYELGLELSLNNITDQSIEWTVNEVLTDNKYKNNAKQRSLIYRDQPQSLLDNAVFWTEYVVRHNGAHHLKPAITTMPWYQQAMIDVYTTLALIIISPFILIYFIIRIIINCFIKRRTKDKSKKE